MALSSVNERFLMESPVLISPPETELESLSSGSDSHSFHSTLLDDFQLDLELECEEDGSTIITGDDIARSWNSKSQISPVHISMPSFELPGEHQRAFPTIAELINTTTMIDLKDEEVYLDNEDECSRRISTELRDYDHQTIPTAVSSSSRTPKNDPQAYSYRDVNHDCIVCPLCQILFSSLKSLQMHFLEQHNKLKLEPVNHQCSICGKSYCSKKNLARHCKSHTVAKYKKCKNQGPFSCHVCSYVSQKEILLQQHLKSKHNSNRETYACHLCSFSCVQERSLKVHMLRHEGVEGKFACDQCGKLFFTMSILKRHARTHNATRPYVCDFENCRKSFNIKSRLTDHMRTVHNNYCSRQPKVETVVKEVVSKEVANLQTKKPESTTATDTTHSAMQAPLKYHDSLTLSSLEILNSKETCGNESTTIYDIILPDDMTPNHADSGVDTSTSTLNVITKSSDSRSPLHSTVAYSQEAKKNLSQLDKIFMCSWTGCGKHFRDGYNLRKHMCTHTGEMERACPLCRYQCIQKSAMDKHMKTHKNFKQSIRVK